MFAAKPGTIYASGPNKGQAYTGNAIEVSAFDTSFDDLGSTANALKLSKTFDLANGGKLTPLLGWDFNNQSVSTTWALPHYLITATGNQPVMLSGQAASGPTDANGLVTGDGWGRRADDVKYRMSSPYFNLSYEAGPLNLDGGVRRDNQKVQGYSNSASASPNPAFSATPTTPVNYEASATSYSLGGNYRITNDLAAFGRYSNGNSFGVIERMGSVPRFDGSVPTDIYNVKQTEIGAKWRKGGFSAFVTLFKADTDEANFSVTTQTASKTSYTAHGLEVEASYRAGGFRINGGVTYTRSRITFDNNLVPSTVGNTPHRLPDFQYSITPSYTFGDLMIGGSLIGQSKAYGGSGDSNDSIQDAYRVVNLFGSYQIDAHTSVWFSANNIFNAVGYTESQYPNGTEARSINGRTARIGLKYTF